MLDFIKELKELGDKILEQDKIIVEAKKELKEKVKSGDITLNKQKELQKNIVDLVYKKLDMVIDFQYIINKYNFVKLPYECNLFSNFGEELNYGYCSKDVILNHYKTKIEEYFIKKHYQMISSIRMSKEFAEFVTGEKWKDIYAKSKYIKTEYDEGYPDGTVAINFELLVKEQFIKEIKSKALDFKMLYKFIEEGKCILIHKPYMDREYTNENVNENYVFDLTIDHIGNSVYEKIFPNLREQFWEYENSCVIENIKNQKKDIKNSIRYYENEYKKHKNDLENEYNKLDSINLDKE